MATSALIGALRVTLGLDSAQFEAGASKAEKRAQTLGSRVSTSMGKAGSETLKFGAAFTGLSLAAGGAALGMVASHALDYASSLGEVAQQLGVTTKDLQEYRYAATQVGIAQETMDKGLAKLTVSMGQARAGVEKPKAAFEQLSNLLGKDLLKNAATAGDAIPLIADAMAKVKDPTKRAAIEIALFGKAGQQLDTLLSGGSAAVNGLRDAAQKLGVVLSDEQIQRADETADKLSAVKKVLEANIAGAVSDNVTWILALADAFGKLATAVGSGMAALSDFKNLQGYKSGDMASGMRLAKSKSGRTTLIDHLDGELAENSRQRAEGGGDDATRYMLDRQFQRLNKRRNAVLHLDAVAGRVKPAGRIATTGDGAGASSGDASRAAAEAKRRQAEAERAAKEAEQNRRRYEDELRNFERDQLGLENDLTSSLVVRAANELRRIDLDQEAFRNQIAQRLKDGEITKAQAARLTAAGAYNAVLEQSVVEQRLADDTVRQTLDIRNEGLSLEADLLRGQLSGARTSSEQRRLQLALLDIEYDRQRAALEAVLALNSSTDAEKKIAQARLDQLGTLKNGDADGIKRDTMGPLGKYLDQMPKTAAELNEAYEKVAADGLQSLNDGLVDAIMNSKSLGDVFSNVAKQIVADLLRIAVQKAITNSIGNALGSIFGGSAPAVGDGGGSNLGSLFGGGGSLGGGYNGGFGAGSDGRIPGLATGGSFKVGGASGIDRNVLSINGIPRVRVSDSERVHVTPANDRGGQSVVQLVVGEGQMFEPRVTGISGNVSVQTIGAAQRRAGMRAGRRY